MVSKEKKSGISDSSIPQESSSSKEKPIKTFQSASSHKVGETYECGENTKATKLAEITIHVYRVHGHTDMGHSMSVHRNETFDTDADTATILTKIAKDCANRYKNRKDK